MQIKGLTFWSSADDILRPDGFSSSVPSLLLSTLAINILSLALPVMTLQIYDRILPNPGSGTLPVLIVGVCVAVMLEAILRLCRSYVIGRSGATYEHLMSCKAMGCVLNADLSRMGSYGIGEHLHRMGAVGKLKDFYNGAALTTLAELVFVPLFFILIAFIAGWLVAVPLVILAVFVAVCHYRGEQLHHALDAREQADDQRFNFLIETLEGVHTLKAFALEKFFERRYEALEEVSTARNFAVTEETASTFNIGAIFSHIMVACVITIGAALVLYGHITTGALIATLLLSGRLMQPVQKALAMWARYQDYSLARRHLSNLFATPQQHMGHTDLSKGLSVEGMLDMRNVAFTDPENGQEVLKNVSLSLKRGDAVLITGAHGAGKSTLMGLISGLYPPSAGEILVDGLNLTDFTPENLTRHVGYIRTDSMVFRGTVRDNITCFGQTDEAQAREVAALLQVDRDVAKLPGGFDTLLSGNDTDSIPPGLKHRIAIVRVLAAKPRLILFDNADRSLDQRGYSMMYSLLARLKGRASMVLVSDDRNIRGLADRSYHLQDGVLTQTGDGNDRGNIKPYRELRL